MLLYFCSPVYPKRFINTRKKKVKVKPKGIDVAEICPLSTNLLLTANYFFQWLAHQRLWRANQEEPSENKERLDRKGQELKILAVLKNKHLNDHGKC